MSSVGEGSKVAETILQRLFDEMHEAPLANKLTSYELIFEGLNSQDLVVRNIAKIIAERRGMQVVGE